MIEDELGRCVASGVRARPASPAPQNSPAAPARRPGRSISCTPDGNIGAILRRAPTGYGASPGRAVGLDAEATLMQLAHDAGVPSPRVLHVLTPEDELGTGYIMRRVEGETIARKILRDDQFANARPILARQLGGDRRHSRLAGMPSCRSCAK